MGKIDEETMKLFKGLPEDQGAFRIAYGGSWSRYGSFYSEQLQRQQLWMLLMLLKRSSAPRDTPRNTH